MSLVLQDHPRFSRGRTAPIGLSGSGVEGEFVFQEFLAEAQRR